MDDHDGLTNQSSIQDDNEMSESDIEETDEMLLQPPPMFARYSAFAEFEGFFWSL